jgi:hypothetical protein
VRPAPFLLAWAAWLTALAAMLAIWSPGNATPLLLFAGGVPAAAAAAYSWRRPGDDDPRLISDSSAGAVLVAIGISVGLVGTTAGLWLALVGGEIAAFGAGALLRELRGMRRAAAAARTREPGDA